MHAQHVQNIKLILPLWNPLLVQSLAKSNSKRWKHLTAPAITKLRRITFVDEHDANARSILPLHIHMHSAIDSLIHFQAFIPIRFSSALQVNTREIYYSLRTLRFAFSLMPSCVLKRVPSPISTFRPPFILSLALVNTELFQVCCLVSNKSARDKTSEFALSPHVLSPI